MARLSSDHPPTNRRRLPVIGSAVHLEKIYARPPPGGTVGQVAGIHRLRRGLFLLVSGGKLRGRAARGAYLLLLTGLRPVIKGRCWLRGPRIPDGIA